MSMMELVGTKISKYFLLYDTADIVHKMHVPLNDILIFYYYYSDYWH